MSTTTTTTLGPCNNTCPPDNWRDTPVLDPWTTTTTTTTTPGPTTTTTTTTESPCTGNCQWDWNIASNKWVKSSSTCSIGCACTAPTFCPPNPNAPACTQTICVRSAYDSNPPNCPPNGTTTTTTTTAGPPGPCTPTTTTPLGCVPGGCTGCNWYCRPAFGIYPNMWVLLDGDCDPCGIRCKNGCPAPTSVCDGDCSIIHTDCVPLPPPPPPPPGPYCYGACTWIWDSVVSVWHQDDLGNPCQSNLGNADDGQSACRCSMPDFNGAFCAQPVQTPCYIKQTATTTTPSIQCIVDPPFLTTPGPGPGCAGACTFRSDGGTGWIKISGCPGCSCAYPPFPPTALCSMTQTPCMIGTTTTTTLPPGTTTTTTPPPTTTTTTPPPQPSCDCQFNQANPYSGGPCSGSAAPFQSFTISGLEDECSTLNRSWNLIGRGHGCTWEEQSGDFYAYMTVSYDVPTGHAIVSVVVMDTVGGVSLTYAASIPAPMDCCGTLTLLLAADTGSCTQRNAPASITVTASGSCTCPTTTTTTEGPPWWCVDMEVCDAGCATNCQPFGRSCQQWASTPPLCFGGGNYRRTTVAGPFQTAYECESVCTFGGPTTTTTTTTTTAGPSYVCYLCSGAGTCYEYGAVPPGDCVMQSGPYPTLAMCRGVCLGGVSP